jgi:hypothetical protein
MALGKVLDGFFDGNPIRLQGAPIPTIPADQGAGTFVTVVDGYRRLAVSSGVEALRASRVRTGGIALVVIAGPDPEAVKGTEMARGRGVVQIQPSRLVFVGMRPEHLV